MKKFLTIAIIFIVCLTSGCSNDSNQLYQHYKIPNERHFGKETYSEILYKYTEAEKNIVEPILETAENIFSCFNPKDDADNEVGELSRYYFYEDMASEEHLLEFVAAKLEEQTGTMWVAYYRKAFDNNGKAASVSGSENNKILNSVDAS